MRTNLGLLNKQKHGLYWSGIFSGKTVKMAAGCEGFLVIFGIFSQVCYPSLPNNGN